MFTTRAARATITFSRLYSTAPSNTATVPSIHSVQSRPKSESIKSFKEAAGDTNRSILDAIAKTEAFAADGFLTAPSPVGPKKTISADKPGRDDYAREPRSGAGAGDGRNGSNDKRGNSKQTSLLGRQLVERRNANGGVIDEAARDITPASRRGERTDRQGPRMGASSSSPRFSSSPRERSSPSSSSSRPTNKSSQKPRTSGAKQARQPARVQLPMNVYSPAPLDLAALIKEDLASRSAFLRSPTTDKATTPAEAQKERLAIKAENLGDYSRFWLGEEGKTSSGKGAETVGRARRMLIGNPSVKLEQREAFLDIVGKALEGKRA